MRSTSLTNPWSRTFCIIHIYPFKSLIITTIIKWNFSTKVIQLIKLLLSLFNFNCSVIHGIDGIIDEMQKRIEFIECYTVRFSVLLLRMRRKFETLVVLDNLVDVRFVDMGGHTDDERHCVYYLL